MATEATADSIPAAVAGRDAAAAAAAGAGAGVSDLGKEIKKEKQKPSPIDTQNSEGSSYGPKTPSLVTPREREKKLGHRRVDEEGIVTYKKKPTSELMAAIQLGIGQSVGGLSSKPERDVLLQDFAVVESVFFPREGSNLTPAHHHSDFRFKTYAPVAFRYFRELFGIQADDFMLSLCNEALCELSNPGASGSIFYISNDDEFIIKTVQHKEADFLQKLLPGYYMNLNQNPRTLLPKFYGLYCYQCGGKNIRFIVMNNLLPSSIRMHEKYDLKGSTYKRKASKRERLKDSPTLKDLDFMDNHPEGILLEKETYDALIKTLQRDCRVLESFKIMDYSFLVGIHNLDLAAKEKSSTGKIDGSAGMDTQASSTEQTVSQKRGTGKALARGKSMRTRLAQYSTAMEAIQATSEPNEMENEDVPLGGIPARTSKGDRILLYVGLIDILQSYRLKKKLEHTMKAIVIEGDTISVHRPGFYAQRFQTFYATRAFKKIQTPLKHSPSKKKSTAGRPRVPPVTQSDSTTVGSQQGWRHSERTQRTISFSDEGAVGGKPDIVPEKRFHSHTDVGNISSTSLNLENDGEKTTVNTVEIGSVSVNEEVSASKRSELLSNTTAIHTYQNESIATMTHHTSNMGHSPPLSLSESTPTHTEYTEGTPSYTTSSPSCSSDVLDSQTGQAAAGDSRTSPLSLSPEKMSPVKKTSSSTETSFASAVETQDTTEMCVVDQRIMQTVAGENQVDEVTHL